MCVVFKDDFVDQDEKESARRVWQSLSQLSHVPFNLSASSERRLLAEGQYRNAYASVLLSGVNIRKQCQRSRRTVTCAPTGMRRMHVWCGYCAIGTRSLSLLAVPRQIVHSSVTTRMMDW